MMGPPARLAVTCFRVLRDLVNSRHEVEQLANERSGQLGVY